MAFILSSDTTISNPFGNAVSVNTAVNARRQDLYHLSSTNPIYDIIINYKTTLTVNVYSPGPAYSTAHSVNCQIPEALEVSVVPGFCGAVIRGLQLRDDFYVSGYSYSKNRDSFGIESWSLTTADKYYDEDFELIYESAFFRGVAMGTSTSPFNNTGVVFTGETVQSQSMSVSAGFPGIGTANVLHYGRVTQVGRGVGPGNVDGKANVTIPYVAVANPSGQQGRIR